MGLPLPRGPVEPGRDLEPEAGDPRRPRRPDAGTEQVFTYRGPEAGGGGKLEAIDLTIKYDP